jgi:type IV fimbrial biogenesis protein FimT
MDYALTRNSAAPGGFTLIELIVAVAIVAVLSSLAAPSFREYIANQRVKNASFDLVAALSFSRSEALKRNAKVDVVPAGGDWAQGWTIKLQVDNTELRKQNAFTGLAITETAALAKLTYGNDGRMDTASAPQFTIALPVPISGVGSRCVKIDLSGTPRSNTGGC